MGGGRCSVGTTAEGRPEVHENARLKENGMTDVAKKLQIKAGQTVAIENAPKGFTLDLQEDARLVEDAEGADVVLVFVKDLSELAAHGRPFMEAAGRDALAYVAYPKAGQLGTDLNRDVIWRQLTKQGLRGVRQVSLDNVSSAMRFRPEQADLATSRRAVPERLP